MAKPGLALAVDPQPGDRVVFKYQGRWVPGTVTGEGTKLRLPVQRPYAATAKLRRAIYWRNRTKIYQPAS